MRQMALFAATCLAFSGVSTAHAQTEHIFRGEVGLGLMLPPQEERFRSPGFDLGGGYEARLRSWLGLELRYAFVVFGSEFDSKPGITHDIAAGLRLYPWLDEENGTRLWTAFGPALSVTGGESRLALHGGVGMEFTPSENLLVGPMIRLNWIIEQKGGLNDDRDAAFLVFGATVGWGMGGEEPAPTDEDGDGLLDDDDACPSEAEDRDGHEDDDGCPDPDNDGDGVRDGADLCDGEAETVNEFEDEDGCPDEVPPPDADGDGVLDEVDRCPEEPEDIDGFADEDGCPEPDNDGDGVVDADDRCPVRAETMNGFEDGDGCPDVTPEEAQLTELAHAIHFRTGSATVDTPSRAIIREVAEILNQHPDQRIRVEGHTDSVGDADRNRRLSQRRADAVRTLLIRAGVDGERLTAVGYGEDRFEGEDETESPEARRVELTVLRGGEE